MAISNFLETAHLKNSLSQVCIPIFPGATQPVEMAEPGKEQEEVKIQPPQQTLNSGFKAILPCKAGDFEVGKDKCLNKPLQPSKTVVLFSH